jgi:hypothetical protein
MPLVLDRKEWNRRQPAGERSWQKELLQENI